MYAIRLADDIAETQIEELTASESKILAEAYEVLQMSPANGRKLGPSGNMYI